MAAQPKNEIRVVSRWEYSITQAWPCPWLCPFLLVANRPKRTHVKDDLKPATTTTEGNGTAGWPHSAWTPRTSHHERPLQLWRRHSGPGPATPGDPRGLLQSHQPSCGVTPSPGARPRGTGGNEELTAFLTARLPAGSQSPRSC